VSFIALSFILFTCQILSRSDGGTLKLQRIIVGRCLRHGVYVNNKLHEQC